MLKKHSYNFFALQYKDTKKDYVYANIVMVNISVNLKDNK